MSNRAPASYEEIAKVLASLPVLLREARRARGLSLYAAAEQIGCGQTTVRRTEEGELPSVHTALAMLRWLGGPS